MSHDEKRCWLATNIYLLLSFPKLTKGKDESMVM